MNKLILFGLLVSIISGCSKLTDDGNDYLVARIEGYDLNCATCILSFPDDSVRAREILGESRYNFYQTVNLDKNSFDIGQRIKVRVRNAEDTELRACIAMYPSFDYINVFVTEYDYNQDFVFNDTIELGYKECLTDFEKGNVLCFDSVLTDSRCPEDVVCIWAGEAIVRFSFKARGHQPVTYDLHTGTLDSVINHYRFSFFDLLPYPNTTVQIRPEDYRARIVVKPR